MLKERLHLFPTGRWMWRPGYDGGEADDAAATDGGRPAVAGAGGELHGYGNCIYIKATVFTFVDYRHTMRWTLKVNFQYFSTR